MKKRREFFLFIKAVVYVYVSRAPAALPKSGGGLICHESAGTNYQQALSDRTPSNRDNPGLLMKPKPLLDAGLSYQISHIYQTFSFVMQHCFLPPNFMELLFGRRVL